MLKIRLQRVGRRNNPAFRVVVTESTRGPKSGDNVELVGTYNPHTHQASLNTERIKHWIGAGAQVSDRMHNLLITEKVIDGKKINVLPRKSPIVKEKAEEESKKEEAETVAEESASETTDEAPKTEETKAEEKTEVEETPAPETPAEPKEEKTEEKPKEKEEKPQEEVKEEKETEKKEG